MEHKSFISFYKFPVTELAHLRDSISVINMSHQAENVWFYDLEVI